VSLLGKRKMLLVGKKMCAPKGRDALHLLKCVSIRKPQTWILLKRLLVGTIKFLDLQEY
jgi:hypothetical protein